MPSRNAISFCLFGDNPLYLTGAVRNATLAPTLYPDWSVVFWLGDGVPAETTSALTSLGADCRPSPVPNPMFARFLINDDPSIHRYLVRDCDSRLNPRELQATVEWLSSDKPFHVIRDHPGQRVAMPGGLWGGTTGHINIATLLTQWRGNKQGGSRDSIYNNDQLFLRDMVWPRIKLHCLQHDFCTNPEFRPTAPFTAKFGDYRFCGERIMPDETPEPATWEKRMNWLTP